MYFDLSIKKNKIEKCLFRRTPNICIDLHWKSPGSWKKIDLELGCRARNATSEKRNFRDPAGWKRSPSPGETKIWSYNECSTANVITFLCAGIQRQRGGGRKRRRRGKGNEEETRGNTEKERERERGIEEGHAEEGKLESSFVNQRFKVSCFSNLAKRNITFLLTLYGLSLGCWRGDVAAPCLEITFIPEVFHAVPSICPVIIRSLSAMLASL